MQCHFDLLAIKEETEVFMQLIPELLYCEVATTILPVEGGTLNCCGLLDIPAHVRNPLLRKHPSPPRKIRPP